MAANAAGAGFPSPPLSSPAPSTASNPILQLPSNANSVRLPEPRRTPLKPGSAKESQLLRYIDTRLLNITRRFAKKGIRRKADITSTPPPPGVAAGSEHARNGSHNVKEDEEEVEGYHSFSEVANDLSTLVDVLWVSNTPGIQVPYMLNVALLTVSYLPYFPFAPEPTLELFARLDLVFVSLLTSGTGLTMTEKVRLRSIVERTRLAAVDVAAGRGGNSSTEVVETEEDVEIAEDEDSDDDFGVGVAPPDTDPDPAPEVAMETDRVMADGDGEGVRKLDAMSITDPSSLDEMNEDISDTDADDDNEEEGEGGNGVGLGKWDIPLSHIYAQTLQLLGETMGDWDVGAT
jgi:hypothetical protein